MKTPTKGKLTRHEPARAALMLGFNIVLAGRHPVGLPRVHSGGRPGTRCERGQIEAVFSMGFVAHHLIRFTREALRGEQNASFYAGQGRAARSGAQPTLVAGGAALPSDLREGGIGRVGTLSRNAPCKLPCLRRNCRARALGRRLARLYTPRSTIFIEVGTGRLDRAPNEMPSGQPGERWPEGPVRRKASRADPAMSCPRLQAPGRNPA